jgi:tape measure domain-containing protein
MVMAGTAAWIDVLPNLSLFGTKLNSGVTAAAAAAGRNAGRKFSDSMNSAAGTNVLAEQVKNLEAAEKRAQKAVTTATAQIVKARDEQKSATLRVQAAETKLNETVAKYGAASSQAISAQARLNDARSKARQKDEAYKNAEEQIRAAQNGLKETQTQLAAAQQKASAATGGFRNALQKWKQAVDSAKSSASGLSEVQLRFGETSRRMTARFSAMAGAVGGFTSSVVGKAVSTFASLGSSMVDASDSAQKFASTMSFAGVSDNTIKKLTASTQDYADKTVFNLSDIRNTTAQLASNSVKNYSKLAEAAGNLTAVAGGGAEAYKSVAMVMTQTAGAGKLTTENWNQLSDAIPGASGKLQDAMKKNGAYTGNFRDAMAGGEITAEEFNKAILQLGMADVAKQAAESTTTFEGAMGNWEAAVQKFGMTVLDKVKPQLTGALNAMTDRVSQFTDWFSGAWDGLAAFLSTGKVNKAFAEAFKIDKNSYAGIEDAYQRIQWGYAGLVNFVKTGEFTYEFNRAFENVDRDTLINFKQNLLDLRDAAKQVVENLPGLSAFFDVPSKGDHSNLNKAIKALNVALEGLKPIVQLIADIEKMWNSLSAEQQGAIFDTAIYLWLGSKGLKILKNVYGVGKDIVSVFKTGGRALKAFGSVLKNFKVPKTVSSFLDKVGKTGSKLLGSAGGTLALGGSMLAGAANNLQKGTPKTLWKAMQGVQGKDTSDKAYKEYQKQYQQTQENSSFLGVKNSTWLHNLNPLNWPSMAGNAISSVGGAMQQSGVDQVQQQQAQVAAQQQTVEQIKQAWSAGTDWITLKWQSFTDWIGGTAQTIGGFFASIPSAIGGWFSSAGGWVQSVWNGVTTWFGGVPGRITGWFAGIPGTFSGIFQSAKNGITGIFGSVGGWFNQNVKTPISNAVNAIGNTFSTTKDWIRSSWNQVKDAAKSPVSFIVNTVYTNGIKKVWNSVAGAVGLNLKLPDVKFAEGGINPGYAPGVDSIPAMTSPGEAWMVPEWTRAVGAANIYRWNRIARRQGVAAVREDMMMGGLRFAGGGIVGKVGSAVSGAKKWLEDLSETAQSFVKNPGDWVASKILSPVKSQVAGIGGGQFGMMVGQLPVKAASALVDKAKSFASSLTDKWKSKSESGQYHGAVGGGVEQWRSLVIRVLKELGQAESWADTVLRRMNQESGGNPNAINNWDSNAKAGHPSQGLMQTIPGTFNAYAGPYRSLGITNPLANIYAGMNYALHRYGSLSALNRAGGYAFGGIVGDRPTLYDRGGILPPGRHLVANETKQPELVLTREQVLKVFGGEVRDKGDRTVNLNVNIPERSDPWADASILVRTARHQLR